MSDFSAIRSAAARKIFIIGGVFALICCGLAKPTSADPAHPNSTIEADARSLSDRQRFIIKHRVLREANVSIVVSAGAEPEQFAIQLAAALKDAGAAVSFSKDVAVQTGLSGVAVYYDQDVPADASVFLALDRAGLKPEDHDVPGAPAATIMIGANRAPF